MSTMSSNLQLSPWRLGQLEGAGAVVHPRLVAPDSDHPYVILTAIRFPNPDDPLRMGPMKLTRDESCIRDLHSVMDFVLRRRASTHVESKLYSH